jgi:aspartate aminotransferase
MKSEVNTASSVKRVSDMASGLVGSEIIRLAGEVNERIARGEQIYNLTIGDFDPAVFPIPAEMTEAIKQAYDEGHTNYPAANGVASLREAVAGFISEHQHLDYPAADYLIAGGARPLIYATYKAIVNPGEKVLYPVPSWNNNHYTHLSSAIGVEILTTPENRFMPGAEELPENLSDIALIALCSPLNPTGTVLSKTQLEGICRRILEENVRREGVQKPLFLMYDQIYWQLTFGDTQHFDPVSLFPEMRPYTIYIDGLSKAFAATGVRVGWAFGPSDILAKMRSILGHVGAWAPKAEQIAVGRYLNDKNACATYLKWIKEEVHYRLETIYSGFETLKKAGFKVDAISPQAAIYLTVKFDLLGMQHGDKTLHTMEDVTDFLLADAGVALVPFYAFGAPKNAPWYRLSVGTIKKEEIGGIFERLHASLQKLK